MTKITEVMQSTEANYRKEQEERRKLFDSVQDMKVRSMYHLMSYDIVLLNHRFCLATCFRATSVCSAVFVPCWAARSKSP